MWRSVSGNRSSLYSLPMTRRAAWVLMMSAVVVVAALNSRFIWIDIRGIMHRAVDHLGRDDFELFLHLWTAPVILVLGALQFASSFRARHPVRHRWIGRIYLTAVLVTSVATFRLALHETEGPMTVFGFATLSLLWAGSALVAWWHAMRGHYRMHSEWMVRNYALTLTNVTYRIELHAFLIFGYDYATVHEPLRVLQWIPNLIAAEVLIRTGFLVRGSWRSLASSLGVRLADAGARAPIWVASRRSDQGRNDRAAGPVHPAHGAGEPELLDVPRDM